MKTTHSWLIILFIVNLLAITDNANAQTKGGGASTYLATIGQPVVSSTGTGVVVRNGDILTMVYDWGRSYSCEGIPARLPSTFSFLPDYSYWVEAEWQTATGRLTGDMSPRITSTLGYSSSTPGTRISFQSGDEGAASISMHVDSVGGELVRLKCEETTLFGDFNTYGTKYNFLELTNTSSDSIAIELLAFTTSTTADGVRYLTEINAGNRMDIDIHSRVGDNVFGTLRILHNGPPNALQAVVSRYAPGTTGEESLVLRGRAQLTTINNN